jgi:dTMP kinase
MKTELPKTAYYLILEGIDGAGKTLQAKRLVQRLNDLDLEAVYMSEPTQGPLGQELRRRFKEGPTLHPLEALGLFVADRRQRVAEIRHRLEDGQFIVQDRSWWSTVVYQGLQLANLPTQELVQLHDFMPKPDSILLIDASSQTALDRLAKKGEKGADVDAKLSFEELRNRYLTILHRYGEWRYHRIDGNQSIEEVGNAIWGHVSGVLQNRGIIGGAF